MEAIKTNIPLHNVIEAAIENNASKVWRFPPIKPSIRSSPWRHKPAAEKLMSR